MVRAITAYLKQLPGCHYEKRHGSPLARAGNPDIMVCYRGRHYEFEVKVAPNKPTSIQEAALRKWQGAGAQVAVVHSVDEVRGVLGE